MDFSEEELVQIFNIFKSETEEHIENINKSLLDLEKNPTNNAFISELFREAHSVKGAARMIGANAIQNLAHKIEDLLKLAKDGAIEISSEIIDILYEGTDTIDRILKKLTSSNLGYADKGSIELAFKIDLIKDNLLLEEKKKNSSANSERKTELTANNLTDEASLFRFIKKHTSLLDNKFQKDNSLQALLGLLEDELNKGLPENEKTILNLTKENLLFIKENSILPPMEIAQTIEQALKTIGTNPTEEQLAHIIKKQQSVKQLLILDRDKDRIFAVEKIAGSDIDPDKKTKTKYTPEAYIDGAFKTLRVNTDKLDNLEKQSEELIVLKIKSKQHTKVLKETMSELSELQKRLNKTFNNIKYTDRKDGVSSNIETTATIRNAIKHLEKANDKMSKLYSNMEEFQKSFLTDDSKLNLLADNIETTVKSIRILPLATIFHMFPRMVRDISRNQGKQVEIIITGSETGADKTIVEELKSPLVHIINNAIDHGIETPEERIKKGKNPTGKILLNSYHSDNSIVIEITDDGKGLNVREIREKALKENFLAGEEIEQLSEYQIQNLIFWPGFTTESKVTNLSGRGVGLDVVHTTISRLDGRISIQTKEDEGFRITIKIPIVIATLKALLVKSENQIFGIPSAYVKHVRSIIPEDIFTKEGKPHILYNGNSVRLAKLSELLHYRITELPSPQKFNIVIIQVEDTLLALNVDELLRTEEIIQKKLNPPLSRVKNIAGISSLSSGESCLILNVNDVINSSLSATELIKSQTILTLPKNLTTHIVLIVDDSYTTLMLEKNILKSAGYKVITANNGAEALKKLTYEKVDVIITDLEMPKMDGIEFVQKVREKDTNTPIIVLTSHEEKLPNIYVQNFTNGIILKKDFTKSLFLQKIRENLPD